jgi:hypothetical protein
LAFARHAAAQYGGTNFHLGVPFVGWLDEVWLPANREEDIVWLEEIRSPPFSQSLPGQNKYYLFRAFPFHFLLSFLFLSFSFFFFFL